MKFRDSNSLGGLLVAALSSNPITDFPIETVCNDFGAKAGAFWVRSKLDEDRIDLVAVHAIKEQLRKVHDLHFYLDDYADLKRSLNFVDSRCELSVEDIAVLPPQASDFFASSFARCTIIESWSKQVGLVAAIQLYSDQPLEKFDSDELHHLSAILGRFVETFAREQEVFGHDRDKVAHEVARHLTGAANGLRRAKRRLAKGRNATLPLNDVEGELENARTALSQERIIEGVIARRQSARYESLREVALKSFHTHLSALNEQSRDWNVSNALLSDMLVKMHIDDLQKVISNVVENAAKYSMSSGSVLCSTSEVAGKRLLTISNLISEPFAEEELEKLWRLRHRGPNAQNKPGEGFGLPIVKETCGVYGIQVELRQRPKGSTTWIDVIFAFPKGICIRS